MLDKKNKYKFFLHNSSIILCNLLFVHVHTFPIIFNNIHLFIFALDLNKRELIKISILKTYTELPVKELAELLASSTTSEIINIIGRTIVLYKKNPDINAYGC